MANNGRAKIALVVPSLADCGGVQSVVRFIRDAVVRSDEFDLRLVSLATSASDPSSVRLLRPATWPRGVRTCDGIWEGLPYRHIGAFATELEFQRYWPRAALTKELADCDLVQVVSGGPSWALSVRGLGRPVVLQVATRTIVERQRSECVERGPLALWRRLMTRITDKLDDRALRFVDAVLVENPTMFKYASRLAEGRAVWVRYGHPGVDTDLFHPLSDRLWEVNSPGYILSVGRLDDPRKNVDLLLEAYAVVRQRTADPPSLRLVGPASPGRPFWQRVQALGLTSAVSVDVGVSRKELVGIYQNARVFALASDEEGFGIALVEAMACGVPVVATRCGGPEGVISDGVDGYLVSRADAIELAVRMSYLSENRAENLRMGIKAAKTVERRFSVDIAGETFLDTYRQLLAG